MNVARELHPWNEGFRWEEHTGPFTTITNEQAEQFDRDGYFVLEDAFDADLLAEIDAAIAPGDERVRGFLDGLPDGRFGVAGNDTQTIAPHLVVRSEVLARFFGRDDVAFETASDDGAETRAFESFSQAAEEAGRSRIYGGIHFEFDNRAGLDSGRAVGRYVFENRLRPLRDDASAVVARRAYRPLDGVEASTSMPGALAAS